MKIRQISLLLIAVIFLSLPARVVIGEQTEEALAFAFVINSPSAATSAGVYDSNGILIRTLWANVFLTEGNHVRYWDGKNDLGILAPRGTYTIKLLTNNVIYKYDGKIGTTSGHWYEPDRWENFGWNGSLHFAFSGSRGWIATGYAEGTYNVGYFDVANPFSPLPVSTQYVNQNIELDDIATDGQWVYLMNRGAWHGFPMVTAIDAKSGFPVSFSSGMQQSGPRCAAFPGKRCGANDAAASWFNTTTSYIDPNSAGTLQPTGIAVQREGRLLAVAHGDYVKDGTVYHPDMIKLFDKRSGVVIGVISTIHNPTQMAFDSKGLWVLGNGTLYLVTSVGNRNSLSQPLSGLSHVLSVDTNPVKSTVVVLDGGSSQQMKEYSSFTYQLIRSYGIQGGYSNCDPTISTDRLMLDSTAVDGRGLAYRSWVRVQDSDDIWIQDGGNGARILHISPSNHYVDQILFTRPSYHLAVSETLPSRLFMGMLEYAVDYSVLLKPGDPDRFRGGNESWRLLRNWSVCADGAAGSSTYGFRDITNLERLANGGVYATAVDQDKNVRVVELPRGGKAPLRSTPVVFRKGDWRQLLRDGSLSYSAMVGAQHNCVSSYTARLAGFDANRNPHWEEFRTETLVCPDSKHLVVPNSGWGSDYTGSEATKSGYFPIYAAGSATIHNSKASSNYPHLAGAKPGLKSFAWTSMPEECVSRPDLHGAFPCSDSFGGHDGVGPPRTEGKSIFVLYDGQYASYGAQVYHFWEDGLLVGQFGNTYPYPTDLTLAAHPGNAGNIATFGTTTYKSDIFVYMPDESFAPISRWRIANVKSVHEFSANATIGVDKVVDLAQLF